MRRDIGADESLTFDVLMADPSGSMRDALAVGRDYLRQTPRWELLANVGKTVHAIPSADFPDKRWFQKSYGRAVADQPDELLAGAGLLYLTEQRKLFLDCTGGHYQMTWGYDHPELHQLLLEGIEQYPTGARQASCREARRAGQPRGGPERTDE